jgi:hypothetical protein
MPQRFGPLVGSFRTRHKGLYPDRHTKDSTFFRLKMMFPQVEKIALRFSVDKGRLTKAL